MSSGRYGAAGGGPLTAETEAPLIADIAAERAVLGAAMLSPKVVEQVVEILDGSHDFVRPAHRMIWQALVDLALTGRPTGPVVLLDELRRRGQLGKVGEGPYLSKLHGDAPPAIEATYHADTIAGLGARRRALETIDRARQSLENPGTDPAEVIADTVSALGLVRHEGGGQKRGQSWQPVDLGPILRGEKTRPEPSVGITRSDGLRLIYPGKEHTVIGAMESGKSWFCAACCAAELVDGNPVLYLHFEEADATDTVERLQALGVADDVILKFFRFVGPEEPTTPELLAALLDPVPTLVVLDGVNEAMALHGQAIREEDGAADFRRRLVKPCTAVGAATLGADHVVKDRERRDLGPLGSVHKGNGLSGSLILLENAEPFGRGARGRSHVFVTKDRPGHLRRAGKATKVPGKTLIGELVVDDTRLQHPYLDLTFWAPAKDDDTQTEVDPHAEDDAAVLAVVRALLAEGKQANVRNVRARSVMSNSRTDKAIDRLTLDGRLTEHRGEKNARVFTVPEDELPEESE